MIHLVRPWRKFNMRVEQEKVEAFHVKYGQVTPETPELGDPAEGERRFSIMDEELKEYMDAICAGDLVKVADAIADLLYTVLGTAVHHGIDIQPIFEEVHRSNMTKDYDPSSFKRAVKGPTFEPARIAELLLLQMHPELPGVK